LVAKPSHANAPKGDIELPPLPTGFSQASLGSLAAVDKTPQPDPAPAPEPAPIPEPVPEVVAVQPEVLAPPVAEPEVPAAITEPIATTTEPQPRAVFDAPVPKQPPSSTTQKPRSISNLPILLGVITAILMAFAVYFFGFRDSPSNDGANNAQPSAHNKKPETSPAPPVQKAPEPEPVKPAPALGNKVTKPSAPEVKPPPKKSPTNTPVEPAKPAPPPEKEQPPAPSIPDLNRMVNEALKR
jgi:hypothetical protein